MVLIDKPHTIDGIHLAIPSLGRPARQPTWELFNPKPTSIEESVGTIYVEERQVNEYRSCYPFARIQSCPNDLDKKVGKVNFIMDQLVEMDYVPDTMFLDDDHKTSGWYLMESRRSKPQKMDSREWHFTWRRLFDVAYDLGYRLIGVRPEANLFGYYPQKPINFRAYIAGPHWGLTADGIRAGTRIDPEFSNKDDYDLVLRCIMEDGGVVAARHVHWVADHYTNPGGLVDIRTGLSEEREIKKLIRKYPGLIRSVKRKQYSYAINLTF